MSEKIPHYINDPIINAATAPELKLYRPKINYFKEAGYILLHICVGFGIAFVWTILELDEAFLFANVLQKMCIVTPLLFLCTLRFTFIWFVRMYQHYAKSETRLRCCMTPSCSEYAILAFKKYGAILGAIKTFRRLLRCHPPGGVDYP